MEKSNWIKWETKIGKQKIVILNCLNKTAIAFQEIYLKKGFTNVENNRLMNIH